MNRLARRFVTVAVGSLFASIAIQFTSAQIVKSDSTGNVVKNGSFEEGSGDAPAGWQLPKDGSKGTAQRVAGASHSGSYGIKLAPNRNNEPSEIKDNPLGIGQGFPAGPFRGKKVYLSGWLGAEGGAKATLALYGVTRSGGAITVELEENTSGTNLRFHEDVLVVPDDRSLQFLVVLALAKGTSGAAYFDDVVMSTNVPEGFGAGETRSGSVTGKPSREPSTLRTREPLGAMQATITVDASRMVRDIPPGIYGTNLEWIWDANGIWDAKRQDMNPSLVRLTRDLGTTLLRFPGGIFGDFYNWRDGIGPRESRKQSPHSPSGGESVHRFGTDEALEFARLVGGELLISVNAGTGDAKMAGDWVRYVKGKGRQVRYWEIGNELYAKDDSPHSRASTIPPERYARRFLEFAQVMRQADPTIKLGAIGEENFGNAYKSYDKWTDKVLREAGNEIDFLAVHNGYAPAIGPDKGWSTRAVYASMLAAPEQMRQNLEDISGRIDRLVPGRSTQIKLAITEWGPYFQLSPDGRFVDHVKTLGSALFAASALKVYALSPKVEIANFFKLVDGLFQGWIGVRKGEFVPRAPYYALMMYTRHFGTRVVFSDAVSPKYDATAVGWVKEARDVPYLDVISSLSGDGRKLFVLAINKNFDQPVEARLTLRGFQPGASATAWTLNGASIDANTGTELFQAPGVTWARQAEAESNPQFYKGQPDAVKIESKAIANISGEFMYRFPAHSVTSLEIPSR